MDFLLYFQNHFKGIFPELFLSLAIFGMLVFGVIYTTSEKYNKLILIRTINWLAIQTLIITIVLIWNNPINDIIIFNDLLIIDDFSNVIKIIVSISSICCILLSFEYLKDEKLYAFEYALILLLAILGIFLIISSYSLISMYLAIELQSLSLYIIAAYKRNTKFSTEAGLKYFILGALASGFLLIGCSLMYGFTGLTSFTDFAKLFGGSLLYNDFYASNGIIIGIVFITIALLFKLAAAPFHMWAPDVYEGAPTSVTAFFAIVPKIAILGLLIRFLSTTLYDLIDYWQEIIFLSAIISIVVAAFAALEQKKLKRFLAYSAIGHTGYILIGVATGTPDGIQASLLYMIIYIITSIGVFSIVLSLRNKVTKTKIKYLSELHNLGNTNPVLAISLTIVLFSMAGIPPLAGFIGKLYIFLAAIESSMYLLAIIGVMTSVIGAVYYIRLIKIMYFEKLRVFNFYQEVDREKSILIALSIFFLVFFFLDPSALLIFAHKHALNLCL
jgi:NADH-quinone oxidoreductase subunit N